MIWNGLLIILIGLLAAFSNLESSNFLKKFPKFYFKSNSSLLNLSTNSQLEEESKHMSKVLNPLPS